jgi:hypothetical protein
MLGQSIDVHLNNSLLIIQTQQVLATRCTSSNFGMQLIQIPESLLTDYSFLLSYKITNQVQNMVPHG